ISFCVNFTGLGVRFTSDLLDLPVGVGPDLIQIAFPLTGNTGGFTFPFGTEPLRDLKAFADHALVNAIENIGVVVDTLDPKIEHGDAEPRQFFGGRLLDIVFYFLPAQLDRWQNADRACAAGTD